MVVTVLQWVVALPAVLLVVFSTAMDHETEALEEVLRLHAFLAVVFVSHAVDGTGDTLSHFANPSVETFAHPLSHY